MQKPALIIIDMCQDFFREGRLSELRSSLCISVNGLTKFFRKSELPIIWIRQEFKPDLSDAFLNMRKNNTPITIEGTSGAQLLPELEIGEDDFLIIKKRYSSFFATNLDQLLIELNISHLILAGVNTHACVRATAVDAYQRDFEIIFAEEAINSYDLQFHNESKRYLGNSLGKFISNELIINKFSLSV